MNHDIFAWTPISPRYIYFWLSIGRVMHFYWSIVNFPGHIFKIINVSLRVSAISCSLRTTTSMTAEFCLSDLTMLINTSLIASKWINTSKLPPFFLDRRVSTCWTTTFVFCNTKHTFFKKVILKLPLRKDTTILY